MEHDQNFGISYQEQGYVFEPKITLIQIWSFEYRDNKRLAMNDDVFKHCRTIKTR